VRVHISVNFTDAPFPKNFKGSCQCNFGTTNRDFSTKISRFTGERFFSSLENFTELVSLLSLETWASNLKSVALTGLELLTLKNFVGHVTLATPSFRKILRGDVWTVPENMPIICEVRSFFPF